MMKRINLIRPQGILITGGPQCQEPEFPSPQPEPEIIPQADPDQPFPPEEEPVKIDPDPVPEQAPPEYMPPGNNLLTKTVLPQDNLKIIQSDVIKNILITS